jgi:hypothetical protein
MRWSFHHLRIRALQILTRTVKPSLPLGGYLLHTLAFDSPSEAARFIMACGGALVEVELTVLARGFGGYPLLVYDDASDEPEAIAAVVAVQLPPLKLR